VAVSDVAKSFQEFGAAWINAQGYEQARLLPSGEWAALQKMFYTTGLFVGIDTFTWRTRFCFDTYDEAAAALLVWDGSGFPPGYWIKQKPENTPNPLREERA